eukprot:snap_masked-scaffold_25-processed-gene-4.44-mRNA-1 protein AED:1.00 eAED:1.00 QI:0/-1/0/0/-1/1/1/0/165
MQIERKIENSLNFGRKRAEALKIEEELEGLPPWRRRLLQKNVFNWEQSGQVAKSTLKREVLENLHQGMKVKETLHEMRALLEGVGLEEEVAGLMKQKEDSRLQVGNNPNETGRFTSKTRKLLTCLPALRFQGIRISPSSRNGSVSKKMGTLKKLTSRFSSTSTTA